MVFVYAALKYISLLLPFTFWFGRITIGDLVHKGRDDISSDNACQSLYKLQQHHRFLNGPIETFLKPPELRFCQELSQNLYRLFSITFLILFTAPGFLYLVSCRMHRQLYQLLLFLTYIQVLPLQIVSHHAMVLLQIIFSCWNYIYNFVAKYLHNFKLLLEYARGYNQ